MIDLDSIGISRDADYARGIQCHILMRKCIELHETSINVDRQYRSRLMTLVTGFILRGPSEYGKAKGEKTRLE